MDESIFFKYEAALTNLIFGIYFVLGAFSKKPLVQEFAEKGKKFDNPNSQDLVYYFRVFTLIWAVYFCGKSGFYLWVVSQQYSTEKMLAIRGVVGSGSLYAMIALSTLGGGRLFAVTKDSQFYCLTPTKKG